MSRKKVNLEDKKIKKSDFYKNKKVTKIDDIDVNKRTMQHKKNHLNTLLDTMIMMLLDHYA